MLHNLDFEQFPDEHRIKVREIFNAEEIDLPVKRVMVSHAYVFTQTDVEPEHQMEQAL